MTATLGNSDCPDEKSLRSLVTGRMSRSVEDQLLEHLSTCRRCQHLLDSATSRSLLSRAKKFLSDPGDVPPALEAILSNAELDISEFSGEYGFAVRDDGAQEQNGHRAWADIRPFIDEAPCEDEIGQIGRYHVTRFLGRGGMGAVFEGFDAKLERHVAIKMLSPSLLGNEIAVQRFRREAQAMAAISHPSIIGIHAVNDTARLPYFVMEFVDGRSLETILDRKGRLPAREVLRIGYYIASGLAAAHAAGLIHRDVKPANVLIENETGRVRLLDFGLARGSVDESLTASGALMGTPAYMAPETIAEQPQDVRTDLFSLGAVLYQMLSGELPFAANTAIGTIQKINSGEFEPLHSKLKSAPAKLSKIVEKLLEKEPDRRFQDSTAVAEALRAVRRSPMVDRRRRILPVRNTPFAVVSAISLLAVCLVIFLMAGTGSTEQTPPAVEPAQNQPSRTAELHVKQALLNTVQSSKNKVDAAPSFKNVVVTKPAAEETVTAINIPPLVADPRRAQQSAPMVTDPLPEPRIATARPILCTTAEGQSTPVESLADAWKVVSGGGRVELPQGKWRMSEPVEFEYGKVEIVGVDGDRAAIEFDFEGSCFFVGGRGTLSLSNIVLRGSIESPEDACCIEVAGGTLLFVNSLISLPDGRTLDIVDNGNATLKHCEIINPYGVGLHWTGDEAGGSINIQRSRLGGYASIVMVDCGPDSLAVEDSLILSNRAIVIQIEQAPESDTCRTAMSVRDSILLSSEAVLAIIASEESKRGATRGNWHWKGKRNVYSGPLVSLFTEDDDEPVSEVSRISDWRAFPGIQEVTPHLTDPDEIESFVDIDEAMNGSVEELTEILQDLQDRSKDLRR